MTEIMVEGRRVKVSDEFWSLPRDKQEATVDEIAKSLGVGPSQQFRADQQGRATRLQRESLDAPISRGESFVEGLKQGTTLNTSDEIAGLKAAGTPEQLRAMPNARMGVIGSGLAALGGGVRMLAEKAAPSYFGQGGNQAYDETVARERAAYDRAREANPWTTTAGEMIGGLAVPVPAAGALAQAKAAGQGMKAVGAGMAGGAALGAGAGFGAGYDAESRAEGLAKGAAVGAAIGGLAVPVVSGVQRAGEAIAGAASGVTNRIRGLRDPEGEAIRRAQMAMAKDAQTGITMSGQQLVTAVESGQPIIAADLGGETTRALLRSATNTSPTGREAARAAVADRFESQSDRAAAFLKTFGPTDTAATREALQNAARASNSPAYKKAYADGEGGVWNETLASLAETPLVQQAIQDAVKLARNRAPLDGFRPPRNPFVQAEEGSMALQQGATPTLQFWDHVQRSLRKAADGGDAEAGQLRKMLNGELDRMVPSFNEARSGAAKFFGAEDAMDAGMRFATAGRMNHGEAAAAMRKMSPEDLQLFRQGFLGELTDRIGKLNDTRDLTKAIMQSPDARERVAMVLGPNGMRKLEAFIETEKLMNQTKGVLGGSDTAQKLAELGLGGGVGYYQGGMDGAAGGMILAQALRMGATKIDSRVSERVAKLLSSGDPQDWAKVIDLASKNRQVLEVVRDASSRLTQLAAPHSSAIPIPGIMGSPRVAAETDKRREP